MIKVFSYTHIFSGPFLAGFMGLLTSNNFPLWLKKHLATGQLHRSWGRSQISVLPGILYTNSKKLFSIIFPIILFIIFVHRPSTFFTLLILFSVDTDDRPLISLFLMFHRNRTPGLYLDKWLLRIDPLFWSQMWRKVSWDRFQECSLKICLFRFLFESPFILLIGTYMWWWVLQLPFWTMRMRATPQGWQSLDVSRPHGTEMPS